MTLNILARDTMDKVNIRGTHLRAGWENKSSNASGPHFPVLEHAIAQPRGRIGLVGVRIIRERESRSLMHYHVGRLLPV